MARQALTRPGFEYNRGYMNNLVSEIENRDGLSFKAGERIEVNGFDSTELILVSPDGTKYKLSVDNSGNLATTSVT
tara:strand:+ start:79 stop:306 length:228 start_codon:yes stop_codon:yes gene_type:complete